MTGLGLKTLLAIGCGGFLGAVARYLVSFWIYRAFKPVFPYGTLAVNLVGCLAIGVLATLIETREAFSPTVRLILITGFLGSLTTFSTFGFETVELIRVESYGLALANIAVNVLLGIAAVLAGRALALAWS